MTSGWHVPRGRTTRYWRIPLAAVALILGSLGAVAGGAAAAGGATTGAHYGTTHTRPGGAVGGFQPGGLIKAHGSAVARAIKNDTTSANWSGYVLTGGTGAFRSVSSSWIEPPAVCPDSGTEYAAFWVGLDGYDSDSVEQTGTDSDCTSGKPDYYGWYEMFPAPPVYFTNPVSPGDRISASVSVSGTSYTLTVTDSTRGWTQTEHETASYSNSSAEVITEAPATSQGPLPLADFGTIGYSGSSVNGTSMGVQNPTSITMVGTSGHQLDSTSAMDAAGTFSNSWQAAS